MAEARAAPGITRDLYDLLTGDEDARVCRDIPEEACREQPRNFFVHIASLVATKTGDLLSSPKVVLAWLMIHLGAPAFMLGFLVPVRESLSLLPQLFVAGYIRRVPVRKWFWVAGSVVEGLAVAGMAVVALTMRGAAAGWGILALLVVFSLARGVASIADKDVLGKTVSKSRRGMASGYASSLAGAITVATGAFWFFVAPDRQGAVFFAGLLAAAGALWLLAAFLFSRIIEYAGATEGGGNAIAEAVRQLGLIRRDRDLRQFLIVRTLLLSTALVAPFYVTLASQEAGGEVSQLGGLLIASGAAGFVSGGLWGRLSDRSSRRTMAAAALLAALTGFITVAVFRMELPYDAAWLTVTYFLLNVAHEGVRLGRKTHLLDIATAENRASYVAVSNTVIGVMLLAAGVIVGALVSVTGSVVTVLVLSVLALVAAGSALQLKEAQA